MSPQRMERLVGEVRRAHDELTDLGRRVALVAAPSAAAPEALANLSTVTSWLGEAHLEVRALLDEVRAAAGQPGVRGPSLWATAPLASVGHLVGADRAAVAVIDALADGRTGDAERLLADRVGDAGFATLLMGRLGVEGMAHQLMVLVRTERTPAARSAWRVVRRLGAAHGDTVRSRSATFSLADLALETDRAGLSRAALAVPFVGLRPVPPSLARSLATTVVVPLNRAVAHNPSTVLSAHVVTPAGVSHDGRTLALRTIAASPEAARTALAHHGPDAFLDAGFAYGDGGLALGDFLAAATHPGTGGVLTSAHPPPPPVAAANLAALAEWSAGTTPLPPATEMRLASVLAPWVGAFRSAGLRRSVAHHVVIDESVTRAALTRAARFAASAERLRGAAWTWSDAEVTRLAARPASSVGFDEIGSVVGIVTVADLAGHHHRARGADADIRRDNRMWRQVVSLATRRLPPSVRQFVGPLSGMALDRVLSDPRHEQAYWRRDRDRIGGRQGDALEWLVASALWAGRDENGYFGAGRRPPARLLVDPGGPERGLRALPELSDVDLDAWERWRSDLAAAGPAPLQVALDAYRTELARSPRP